MVLANEQQIKAVAGPRNHLYRTRTWFVQDAVRAGIELQHVRDFARQLDPEAVLVFVNSDTFNKAAQDFKRVSLGLRVRQRGLEIGDLPAVKIRQVWVQACR